MLTILATVLWVAFDVGISVVTAPLLPGWEWWLIVGSGAVLAVGTLVGGILDRRSSAREMDRIRSGQEQHTSLLQALSLLLTPELAKKLATELDDLDKTPIRFSKALIEKTKAFVEAFVKIQDATPPDERLVIDIVIFAKEAGDRLTFSSEPSVNFRTEKKEDPADARRGPHINLVVRREGNRREGEQG